jgi:hypothetical protein
MKALTHNAGWKLLAVALASIIWMAANYSLEHGGFAAERQGSSRITLSHLPITIMTGANEPRHFVVDPSEVRLAVRGDRALLEALRPSDISVFVNLTGITEAREFRKRIEVHTPPGVALVWVIPTEVNVRTDLSLTRPRPPARP